MAKKAKPKPAKKTPTAPEVSELSDGERLQQYVVEIRRQLADSLAQWIEGPLPTRGIDGFALRLCDGDQWYRLKDNLGDTKQRRAKDLMQAARDLQVAESELKHPDRIWLPRLFNAVLRVGIYSERAKVIISKDNHNRLGAKKVLTDDQKIKVRIDREKGRAVKTLAKDYNVSEDTIYRATKTVSHK